MYKLLTWLSVVLGLLVVLVMPASSGAATTITVNCTADSGALASALASASVGDTLAIQGTCKGTFEIAHNLTLQGSGGATLDGQGAGTVVFIDPGKTVVVADLIITGGVAPVVGGGILNFGTLTLSNDTVSGNTAAGTGGGIFDAGSLTLDTTTVSGNSISGNGSGGGIGVQAGATLTASDSTVSGNSAFAGGGVFNGGTVTLANSTVSDNTAHFGGGISEAFGSTLTLDKSTISGNSVSGTGGGMDVQPGATLTATDSAVTGNSASGGGGVFNGGTVTLTNSTVSDNSAAFGGGGMTNAGPGTLTLTNSTVSGNSAFAGGGIFNGGSMTIASSTVSGNSATSAGGIASSAGTATLESTIVASQTAGGNCVGSISDAGYNLEDGTSCGFSAVNHSLPSTNPLLDAAGLKNNGGPTETIALQSGSPAIDAIPVGVNGCGTTIATDQRGVSRPQGPGCDIGAFELEVSPAQLLADLGTAVAGVGPGTSLADKVKQAQTFLATNDLVDTCSTLASFVKEVSAQSGKTIPAGQATALIASAQQIRLLLGGPCVSANLIVNGGAEAAAGGDGTRVVPVPGWTTNGNFTAVNYVLGEPGGWPGPNSPGPSNRGANFFSGGPSNASSSAAQTINLTGFAGQIDHGTVAYDLNGWLGGFDSQNDNATLTVTFKGKGGASLGTSTIGPVLAVDRGNVRGFVNRDKVGTIPVGTRSVLVQLAMTRTDGVFNDGYADNLSLVITP